jgi:hypothetical protein
MLLLLPRATHLLHVSFASSRLKRSYIPIICTLSLSNLRNLNIHTHTGLVPWKRFPAWRHVMRGFCGFWQSGCFPVARDIRPSLGLPITLPGSSIHTWLLRPRWLEGNNFRRLSWSVQVGRYCVTNASRSRNWSSSAWSQQYRSQKKEAKVLVFAWSMTVYSFPYMHTGIHKELGRLPILILNEYLNCCPAAHS